MFVKLCLAIAFVASVVWFILDPGFEPAITGLTTLVGLIGVFVASRSKKANEGQHQEIGSGGLGIQTHGDVTISNIKINNEARNAE